MGIITLRDFNAHRYTSKVGRKERRKTRMRGKKATKKEKKKEGVSIISIQDM